MTHLYFMKRPFALTLAILIMPLLFLSCSKDDIQENEQTNNNNKEQTDNIDNRFYIVDISSESDADIAIICEDGTFIIYDKDNESDYEVVYLNRVEKDNTLNSPMIVLLDNNHLPKYASYNGKYAYFSNFIGNTFDCAVVDIDGSISYYWDLKTDISVDNLLDDFTIATRASDSFKIGMWVGTKLAVYAIIAGAMVYGSPVIAAGAAITCLFTVVSDGIKSVDALGYVSNGKNVATIVDGLSAVTSLGLMPNPVGIMDVIQSVVVDFGWGVAVDNILDSVGPYEIVIENVFANEEWQIKLSTNLLECSMDESTYTVDVATKTAWEVDDSGVDKKWCNVYKENGRVVVRVKENDETEDRVCSAQIRASNHETNDIPPATLTIKQTGVLFKLAPEIVFTLQGGEIGVNVFTSKNIVSWRVTSQPWWCKAEKRYDALFVTVQKAEHLLEDREGIITVTAQLTNGMTIDRNVVVKQIVTLWDGTSWHFKGTVSGDGEYLQDEFTLSIQDAKSGTFSSNVQWDSMELLDNGDLLFKVQISYAHDGISTSLKAQMTVTRTSQTTARGVLSGNVNSHAEGVGNSLDFSGVFDGTLIGSTRAEQAINNGKTQGLSLLNIIQFENNNHTRK